MPSDRKRPSIGAVLCWSTVVLVSSLSAIGIASLAWRMAPVREGESHVFWKIATGVDLVPEAKYGMGGRAYFVNDKWAAYELSHIHGSDIYRVSLADVSADLKEVESSLEQEVQRGEDTPILKGFVKWRGENERPRSGPKLLKAIERERKRELAEDNIDQLEFRVASEQQFWERWQRADWYWAGMVFEWTFLTGLTVFAVWPTIRRKSPLQNAVHVALVPFLFLLPAYLGYATYSFTSAGPSGGILYPFLLMFCRGGSGTAIDRWLLARTPQILEPLSAPIGFPIALTGLGMPGPSYALLAGAIVGAVVFAIALAFCRKQSST